MMKTPISFEEVDGYSIGVRKQINTASQDTILLIHGIGVSSAYFIPLIQELSKTNTVIALDLPGYGKSPKPAQPLTIEQLAQVTRAYIIKHDLEKITVIGHSMGCQIIAHLEKNDNSRLNKMILLSPTANKAERTVFMHGLRLAQDTFHESPKANLVIFSDYIRMGVFRFLKTAGWMVRDHIEKTLINATAETLIIRGGKDKIVPEPWTVYLTSLSPNISQMSLPNTPHAFHFTYPKETAELCRTFIQK